MTSAPTLLLAGLACSRPVLIRVSESIVQPIDRLEAAGRRPLSEYMQLPASHYVAIKMPLDASLAGIDGESDRFRLEVPPVQFKVPGLPIVEASPEVIARVVIEPDNVQIRSSDCTISGSPLIERLRLNERYNFTVVTRFTWRADDPADGDAIFSSTEIDVDVDPPGLFAYVPRSILQRVGNSVMVVALRRLQTPFVANLAADYTRWATDEAYRIERGQQAEGSRSGKSG